jgi:hypothetical protein
MSKPNYNKQIESALNSLDGMQRAEPDPYFETRLSARISGMQGAPNTPWQRLSGFLGRPVVACIGLALMVLLNLWVSRVAVSSPATGTTVRSEFAVNVASNYDLENPETP